MSSKSMLESLSHTKIQTLQVAKARNMQASKHPYIKKKEKSNIKQQY